MSFWETVPGLVASYAAAVAGLIYIASRFWLAARVGKRVARSVARLIEIGDTAAWPNGSHSLPEAMNEIFDRQGETNDLVHDAKARLEDYVVAHRSDHSSLEAAVRRLEGDQR